MYSGKVRELYEVSHDRLLMVASDRVSVFDVVLPDEIPDKGRVLTGVSQYWFDRTADIVPNHVISSDPTDFPETAGDVGGRAMLVRATRPVRLECVVRGYLFGHGWQEYCEQGTVGGFNAAGGPAAGRAAPRAAVHAHHQGGVGSRPAADRERSGRAGGRRRSTSSSATSRSASTRSGAARARTRVVSCSPTRSSSSASSTTRSW